MSATAEIWADIILDAVRQHPEGYPYLDHIISIGDKPESGIKYDQPIPAQVDLPAC